MYIPALQVFSVLHCLVNLILIIFRYLLYPHSYPLAISHRVLVNPWRAYAICKNCRNRCLRSWWWEEGGNWEQEVPDLHHRDATQNAANARLVSLFTRQCPQEHSSLPSTTLKLGGVNAATSCSCLDHIAFSISPVFFWLELFTALPLHSIVCISVLQFQMYIVKHKSSAHYLGKVVDEFSFEISEHCADIFQMDFYRAWLLTSEQAGTSSLQFKVRSMNSILQLHFIIRMINTRAGISVLSNSTSTDSSQVCFPLRALLEKKRNVRRLIYKLLY